MRLPSILRKSKKHGLMPYEFETDKGRYVVKMSFEIKRSMLLNMLNKVKNKKRQFQKTKPLKNWAVGEKQLDFIAHKVLKKIKFEEIIKQVQEDLHNFKVHTTKLTGMKFSELGESRYVVNVEIRGICSGEK